MQNGNADDADAADFRGFFNFLVTNFTKQTKR